MTDEILVDTPSKPKPQRNYATISVDLLAGLDYSQLCTTSSDNAITNAAEDTAIISWHNSTPDTLTGLDYQAKTYDEIIALLGTSAWDKGIL